MEPFRVLFKENGQENLLVPAQEKRGVLREGSRGLQIMSNGELSQAKRKAENMSKVGGMAAVGDNQENSAPKMSTKVQSDALCNQKTTFKGKEKKKINVWEDASPRLAESANNHKCDIENAVRAIPVNIPVVNSNEKRDNMDEKNNKQKKLIDDNDDFDDSDKENCPLIDDNVRLQRKVAEKRHYEIETSMAIPLAERKVFCVFSELDLSTEPSTSAQVFKEFGANEKLPTFFDFSDETDGDGGNKELQTQTTVEMDIIDPDRPSTSKYIEIPQSPSNTFEQPDLHVCEKRLREDPNASKIGSALDDAFMSEYQAEYLSDIRKKEVLGCPKPNFMDRQTDLNSTMRQILVNWLMEVANDYELKSGTIFLAINYVDRFLSSMSVVRNKLQLVGISCLLIACKYLENKTPSVRDVVYLTDNTYTKYQVQRMEQIILNAIAFDLRVPTIHSFCNYFAMVLKIPEQVTTIANFICEVSLLYIKAHTCLPSLVAAGALALARYISRLPICTKETIVLTQYDLKDIKDVFFMLNDALNIPKQVSLDAVCQKYNCEEYYYVSLLEPIEMNEIEYDKMVMEFEHSLQEETETEAGNAA